MITNLSPFSSLSILSMSQQIRGFPAKSKIYFIYSLPVETKLQPVRPIATKLTSELVNSNVWTGLDHLNLSSWAFASSPLMKFRALKPIILTSPKFIHLQNKALFFLQVSEDIDYSSCLKTSKFLELAIQNKLGILIYSSLLLYLFSLIYKYLSILSTHSIQTIVYKINKAKAIALYVLFLQLLLQELYIMKKDQIQESSINQLLEEDHYLGDADEDLSFQQLEDNIFYEEEEQGQRIQIGEDCQSNSSEHEGKKPTPIQTSITQHPHSTENIVSNISPLEKQSKSVTSSLAYQNKNELLTIKEQKDDHDKDYQSEQKIYLQKTKILLSNVLLGNIKLTHNQQKQLKKVLYNPKCGQLMVSWINQRYGYTYTVMSMLQRLQSEQGMQLGQSKCKEQVRLTCLIICILIVLRLLW